MFSKMQDTNQLSSAISVMKYWFELPSGPERYQSKEWILLVSFQNPVNALFSDRPCRPKQQPNEVMASRSDHQIF